MAKVRGVKTGKDIRFPPSRIPEIQESLWMENVINQGMITSFDPSDIPPGALQLAKNAYCRHDKTGRRYGHDLFGPTKPNSNPVLKFSSIKEPNGSGHIVRFTPTTLHELTGTFPTWTWTAITGTLAGTVTDRIQTANILDKFVFSNNGVDEIQLINFGASTFADLGNAPKYRYITGFYNRVVGANLAGSNEVQIGWSGEYGSTGGLGSINEWNPASNQTAGNTPLVDSPSDLSDFIRGVFGFTNIMIVLREKSIWVATKQPIATAPFYFATAVPGIGCDSPYSAAVVGGGIAFLDRRTGTVYAYFPGSQPEPIGRPIEKTLLENVDDPNLIFGSYDPFNNEYSICIPPTGSKEVLVWTFNFRNKSWVRDEIYDLTSMDDMEVAYGRLTIDQLTGIINNLVGTIDGLSPTQQTVTAKIKGRGDGTIMVPDSTLDVDAPHTDYPNGPTYTTDLISKVFNVPINDVMVNKLMLEVIATKPGTISIQYSRTGGNEKRPSAWTTAKSVTVTKQNERVKIIFRKPIRSSDYSWRITANDGLFELVKYEIWTSELNPTFETRPA